MSRTEGDTTRRYWQALAAVAIAGGSICYSMGLSPEASRRALLFGLGALAMFAAAHLIEGLMAMLASFESSPEPKEESR